MKKNIKLVAADIDGTLLAKGDLNNLRESTKKAILDLRKNGILFGLASGRPYQDIMNNPNRKCSCSNSIYEFRNFRINNIS